MELTLETYNREVLGKKVRRLRREGWVPGVVYGTGLDPLPVQIPQREMMELYRRAGTSNMIGLVLASRPEPQPAFIREIQRDVISREILHVDFELVDLNRPITAHIPLSLVGTAPVVAQGKGVLTRALQEVEVYCLPGDVPSRIEVDLSPIRRVDQSILVRDLIVADQVQILTDPEVVVAYVTKLRRLVVEEEEVAEVEEVAEEEEAEPAPEGE